MSASGARGGRLIYALQATRPVNATEETMQAVPRVAKNALPRIDSASKAALLQSAMKARGEALQKTTSGQRCAA